MKRLLRALPGLYLCAVLLSVLLLWAAWEPQQLAGLAGCYGLFLLGWPWSEWLLASTRQGHGLPGLGAAVLLNLALLLACLRRVTHAGARP